MPQTVLFSNNIRQDLLDAINNCNPDSIFVLTDTTTHQYCYPLIQHAVPLTEKNIITIPPSDTNKSLNSVSHVWQCLQQGGATRHSLLINLGGGMVTDLGGFAASTFKRGIHFINIPTTLLAMADASVGGKTGFNFGGLKNEIGVFNDASCVLLSTEFLKTLDDINIRSGYAEMIKHALINQSGNRKEILHQHLNIEFPIGSSALCTLNYALENSVAIKQAIVTEDPHEKNIRKALNFGHTFGHAFESWAMKHSETVKPILHGYAVAYGIIAELYLSCIKTAFPQEIMRQTVRYIRDTYRIPDPHDSTLPGSLLPITCNDYPELLELMTHDKKNQGNTINFTLLADIGDIRINQTAATEEIKEALDFFREA